MSRSRNSPTGSSACCFGMRKLQRTNALLREQLAAVAHERDNLRSRLNAARSRIDVLLERLPRDAEAGAAAPPNAADGEPLRSVG